MRCSRRLSGTAPTARRSGSGRRAVRRDRKRIRWRSPLSSFSDPSAAHGPIQIFATDLGDAASLEKARAGVYPDSIEAEVSAERLQRFFVQGRPCATAFRRASAIVCLRAPEHHRRPAVFAGRSRHLPERADLHVHGPPGSVAADLSFRLEPGRVHGPRPRRNRRIVRRSVRARQPAAQDLSEERGVAAAAADVHGRRVARQDCRHRVRAASGSRQSTSCARPSG